MLFSTPPLRHIAAAVGFLAAGAVSAPASADPSEALDRMSISVGDYIVNPTTSLSVNTPYGAANSGDVSSHEIHIPRLKADFLLGNSQGFALDYYGFYRKYSDTFNRSFSSGPADVTLTGNANGYAGLDLANASYKWWFGEGADVFGVGVGAAYYRVRFGVDGTATSNIDNAPRSGSASYSEDTVAPLVQLGWRHAFSPSTRLYADISGIEKLGGNLSGHIYNAAIGAEWYFMKNLGVGAEYSATRIQINGEGNNQHLSLNMDGPTIFLKARF